VTGGPTGTRLCAAVWLNLKGLEALLAGLAGAWCPEQEQQRCSQLG